MQWSEYIPMRLSTLFLPELSVKTNEKSWFSKKQTEILGFEPL
jgi:hypothetical protein